MAEMNFDELSNIQYDVLRELGNIGAGNATTALSSLINAKIGMKVPKVQLVDIKDIASFVGDEETEMVAIMVMLNGDIEGFMMFLLESGVAKELAGLLMGGMMSEGDDFNEMELSAVREVGNIITGAYLTSLSDLTHLTISESIPYIQIDMIGAIMSVPAIEFGKLGDKILLIETEFEHGITINGYYILVPELASYEKILKALGVC